MSMIPNVTDIVIDNDKYNPYNVLLDVTAYGKCVQGNLPLGFTELNYITGDGTDYVDLGITLTENDVIEIKFKSKYTADTTIFGYRDGISQNNITLGYTSNANELVIDFNNSNYSTYRLSTTTTDDTVYVAVISKNQRTLKLEDGTIIATNTTVCNDSITTGNAYLYFGNGVLSGNDKFTGSIVNVKINGRMNLIPVTNGINTNISFYDSISDSLLDSENWTLISGPINLSSIPTPTNPIDIVCNNGIIRTTVVSDLPNEYTQLSYIHFTGNDTTGSYIDTGLEFYTDIQNDKIKITSDLRIYSDSLQSTVVAIGNIGESSAFIGSNGPYVQASIGNSPNSFRNNNNYEYIIDLAANASYECIITEKDDGWSSKNYLHNVSPKTWIAPILLGASSANDTGDPYQLSTTRAKMDLYYVKIYNEDVLMFDGVPCIRKSDNIVGIYDKVSQTFKTTPNGIDPCVAGSKASIINTVGTKEIIRDSAYNEVTCENLLGFGSTKDEQKIINGKLKTTDYFFILDGSENWVMDYSSAGYYRKFTLTKPASFINNSSALASNIAPAIKAYAPYHFYEFPYGCYTESNKDIVFQMYGSQSLTTVESWKTFLKNMYENNTPVIIVGYRYSSSTFDVDKQTLMLEPITVAQGSVNNLEINVSSTTNNTGIFENKDNVYTIDCSNASWVNNDAQFAFANCRYLTSVTNLNDSIDCLDYTFYGCIRLNTIPVLPNNTTYMNATFSGCWELPNAPIIPNGVVTMVSTFQYCNHMTDAPVIPNSVTDITGCFYNCTRLINVTKIPDSVTSMRSTFTSCTNLVTAPEISNNTVSLFYTFDSCTNLVNYPTIPNSVTNMSGTFRFCTSMIDIPVIPDSVVDLCNCFEGCRNIFYNNNAMYELTGNNVVNVRNTFGGIWVTNHNVNIKIHSPNIIDAYNFFRGNSDNYARYVYVPANSTTYNSFIAAGYDNSGTLDKVYLQTY